MKKIIAIYLDDELWKKAKEIAKKDKRSASSLIELLLERYCELQGNIKKEN